MKKEISYAYPSSALATYLGHAKTGCHIVTIDNDDSKAKAFTSYQDARAYADTLPQPYSRYSSDGYGSCAAMDAIRATR